MATGDREPISKAEEEMWTAAVATVMKVADIAAVMLVGEAMQVDNGNGSAYYTLRGIKEVAIEVTKTHDELDGLATLCAAAITTIARNNLLGVIQDGKVQNSNAEGSVPQTGV